MTDLERKEKRLNYLYDKALQKHLNECDFDVFKWLTDEESDEYEKLQYEIFSLEEEKK